MTTDNSDTISKANLAAITEYILEYLGRKPSWFTRIRYGITKMYESDHIMFYELEHPTLTNHSPFSENAPRKWIRVQHITNCVLLDYVKDPNEPLDDSMIFLANVPMNWHDWYKELLKILERANRKNGLK
jgi:hypothetical protein